MNQVHTPPAYNMHGQPGGPGGVQMGLQGFDGCAIFEVPNLEIFDNAFKDEFYINNIRPDEEKFVDSKIIMWSRGAVKKIL
jgi:hypothetical protein